MKRLKLHCFLKRSNSSQSSCVRFFFVRFFSLSKNSFYPLPTFLYNKINDSKITVKLLFFVIALLTGCTSSDKPYVERPLEEIYKQAEGSMKRQNFEKAAEEFDEVERQYPYSSCAAKSQIFSAYCSFKAQKFPRAIGTLDSFITLHPTSSFLSYAYYLRALCYYTDLFPVRRDPEHAELALQAFQEVIQRFPLTPYSQDAYFKKDFLLEHLASHDMDVGKRYLQEKNFIAAIICFGNFIQRFPRSILMPEVLYRLVECHLCLGLVKGAEETIKLLLHNFPQEKWTVMASQLLSSQNLMQKNSKKK